MNTYILTGKTHIKLTSIPPHFKTWVHHKLITYMSIDMNVFIHRSFNMRLYSLFVIRIQFVIMLSVKRQARNEVNREHLSRPPYTV